ncbi:MAG: futalosine hydrolase [Agriterribacter sp.]
MNILIVAATAGEVNATQEYLAEKMYQRKDCSVQLLTTGVGLVSTTYVLTKYFSKIKPDLVVQAGIAGSLHPFYPPGTVVVVKDEVFGDLGVEEEHSFKDLFDLDLAEDSFPYSSKVLSNPHHRLLNKIKLKQVKGVSVNEITTRAGRTQQIIEKYSAGIESMEGAAFHYVCLQEAIPFVQLRAVSNFIGERDKSKWMIKEAIDNLNKELISFIRPLLCH